jgi:hypothetical protein
VSNSEIFSQIYKDKIWGNGVGVPLSGSGSIPNNAFPYVNLIKTFVSKNEIDSVLDFGHGDFEMWKQWGGEPFLGVEYLGIDIAEDLSEKVMVKYGHPNRRFKYLDIKKTSLPKAQLLVSKDVLQHLPITDILLFFDFFPNFKYIIICNDIYVRGSLFFLLKELVQFRKRLNLLKNGQNPLFNKSRRRNNIDIKSGQFRGIDLEKKPFIQALSNYKIEVLLEYDGPFRPGIKKRIYLISHANIDYSL